MNNLPSAYKAYDVDLYITEIYDQFEVQREDVALLRELIGSRKPLKILELFAGNGRILIPLAQDGHKIVGLDISTPMLTSARNKIKKLPVKIQKNITLKQANVLTEEWPKGFDLVILGGNCFYELATPEEQETCIRKAQQSVKPGGYLYLDNDHMEGDLDPRWRGPKKGKAFPTGVCADGTNVEGFTECFWHDIPNRLVRYRRTVTITTPDGKTIKKEWIEQCHAPSTGEMQGWLKKYGFTVEQLWGGRNKSPYTDKSERAVFWAQLGVK
ncbi:MAG: class I SAM-dependent methyltransferase [Dehalococcoidales bacterium]